MRDEDRPGPHRARSSSLMAATGHCPLLMERPMNAKSILLTAGVALAVVVAYEKSKGKIPALKIGA